MRVTGMIAIFFWLLTSCNESNTSFNIEGLREGVEIIIDESGISHIYAKTEEDLFFAQGFNAARDRLFQLEIWRRQASGTVSQIMGKSELKRDIGARLFKFRGDMKTEMLHYHSKGDMIIESFVAGVNAYIAETEKNPELLPPEFHILGITPGLWTPEIVISRHQGLLGNIGRELNYGRAVAAVGDQVVKSLSNFNPKDPDLTLDPSITSEMLEKDILGLYNSFRRSVTFSEDQRAAFIDQDPEILEFLGSNNWVVNGQLSESGFPMMANDPHRGQAIPSLRYWVHLNGPGWDVIGGGEPEIPGISIGHNGFGAWGLTVFRTDGEDLYVYELNPDNLKEYKYKGEWEEMILIKESIPIKEQNDTLVELRYTRHGPVTFIDSVLNRAYAVRCAWLEPGGAPYLASLRMDQAQSWEEFREACSVSHIPGENMIWADRDGNIGWQAVGIAPVRKNWSGLVPVPGDGRFEWDSYLPIADKPNIKNPEEGYFASANEFLIPEDYPHMDAIGYNWSDPFRGERVREVLGSGSKMDINDMAVLQTDYLSTPARILVPFINTLDLDPDHSKYGELLKNWDYVLTPNSIEASIYVTWERILRDSIKSLVVPKEARPYFRSLSLEMIIDIINDPGPAFGEVPEEGRNDFLEMTFVKAIYELSNKYGKDHTQWAYGGSKFKHIELTHSLNPLLSQTEKKQFNTEVKPRGGYSNTVNSTSGNNNQTHGASFRIIVDTGDFDKTLGCNSPGQSGDPRDPHYKDLYSLWAAEEYFPVFYSRELVEKNTDRKIILFPR